jgi:hypothetical protein
VANLVHRKSTIRQLSHWHPSQVLNPALTSDTFEYSATEYNTDANLTNPDVSVDDLNKHVARLTVCVSAIKVRAGKRVGRLLGLPVMCCARETVEGGLYC